MSKTKLQKAIEKINDCQDFDQVFDLVQQAAGVRVYFDESRAWSLYSTEKPTGEKTPGVANKYGAWRGYLGGGIRGSMNTNLTGDLGDLFLAALAKIEDLINGQAPDDCEVWDLPTGVLL